jgi:hypothetical protein
MRKSIKMTAEYLTDFNLKKGYFTGDQKMNDYFQANYSNNNQIEVFLKVTAIEDNFSRQLKKGLWDFALYISKLNLDHLIKASDTKAVDMITQYPHIVYHINLQEFASTYCNIHNNDAFPIYQNTINDLLKEHLNSRYQNKDFEYSIYNKGMIEFREQLGLNELNFLEFNKFLWLYSERLFLIDKEA